MIISEDPSCDEVQSIPNSRTSKTREIAQLNVDDINSDKIKTETNSLIFMASNVKEMAEALLNGEFGTFKHIDVTNYGCSGCFHWRHHDFDDMVTAKNQIPTCNMFTCYTWSLSSCILSPTFVTNIDIGYVEND